MADQPDLPTFNHNHDPMLQLCKQIQDPVKSSKIGSTYVLPPLSLEYTCTLWVWKQLQALHKNIKSLANFISAIGALNGTFYL